MVVKAIVLIMLVLAPVVGSAQSTQIVPPDDRVYAIIDRLVALRLVDTVLVGQRMLSRRDIGRIVAEARARHAGGSDWLALRLAEFALEYPLELTRAPRLFGVGAEVTAVESPSRGIEPDGNGHIAVAVNPLLAGQLGKPYADGGSAAFSASAGGALAKWLVVDAAGRQTWLGQRGAGTDAKWLTERAYARAVWKNVSLLAGRDYAFFGQGHSASPISSLSPRGIDQLRLSSDRPFRLPWLFRHLGPARPTIVLGDLGSDQFYPGTRYFAYKLSARPHPAFEAGAFLAEQVGGRGAPGGTFLQKAGDAFPLLDAAFLHRNFLFSNKFVGADMRYTLPWMQGVQFNAEVAFDDFDIRRVRSVFTEDAAYVWGLSTTCLGECGPVRASAEYHVTGLRYYTHGIFQGGFTVDNQFIGNPLGPRGKAAYARLDSDNGRSGWDAEFAYESRSGHLYGSVATRPNDADFRFIVIGTKPTERRWRTMAGWRGSAGQRLTVRARAGAERVENFAHVADAWRTNWLLQTGLEYRVTKPSR